MKVYHQSGSLSQEMTFYLTHRSVEQSGQMPRINELFRKELRIMWDQDKPSPIMTHYRGSVNKCASDFQSNSRVRVFHTVRLRRIKSPVKRTNVKRNDRVRSKGRHSHNTSKTDNETFLGISRGNALKLRQTTLDQISRRIFNVIILSTGSNHIGKN